MAGATVEITVTYDLREFDPRAVVRLRAAAEKLRPMASEVAGEFRAPDCEVDLLKVVAAANQLAEQAENVIRLANRIDIPF